MINEKIIFIIPAYNEEMNIKKVLDDIRKNTPIADIIVVNDCSKDNTEKILKREKVDYINHPFNMGYAKAIQTGIKYAFYNNYDYAIQFDADGQHLASEANKLLKKLKNENCDIVIGSRFLKDIGYKHSFFRKIGTKLFTLVIEIYCKKVITDPTSGFQCLDRKIMEHYSKLGNYPEYPDANLIIDLLLKGYKIEEVGVKMQLREFGESMHSGILKPVKYMIKIIYTIFIIILKNMLGGKRR